MKLARRVVDKGVPKKLWVRRSAIRMQKTWTYPCCGHRVRVPTEQHTTFFRRCHRCGTYWYVRRLTSFKLLLTSGYVKLEWTRVTKADDVASLMQRLKMRPLEQLTSSQTSGKRRVSRGGDE